MVLKRKIEVFSQCTKLKKRLKQLSKHAKGMLVI